MAKELRKKINTILHFYVNSRSLDILVKGILIFLVPARF